MKLCLRVASLSDLREAVEQVDPHPVAVAVDSDSECVSWRFCAMEKWIKKIHIVVEMDKKTNALNI